MLSLGVFEGSPRYIQVLVLEQTVPRPESGQFDFERAVIMK